MGFLITAGSTAICSHGGQVKAIPTPARVTVMGQAVLTQGGSFVVSGCPNPPPPAGVGPCATATWVVASMRVKVLGQPALLVDSKALTSPPSSVIRIAVQPKVQGL